MTYLAPTPTAISVQGAVIRCTCTDVRKAAPDWHGALGLPCPQGATADLGVLAYWHPNPLRRWAWRLSKLLRGQRAGHIRTGA